MSLFDQDLVQQPPTIHSAYDIMIEGVSVWGFVKDIQKRILYDRCFDELGEPTKFIQDIGSKYIDALQLVLTGKKRWICNFFKPYIKRQYIKNIVVRLSTPNHIQFFIPSQPTSLTGFETGIIIDFYMK